MGYCRGKYLPAAVAANNDLVNRKVTRKGDSRSRPPLLYLSLRLAKYIHETFLV